MERQGETKQVEGIHFNIHVSPYNIPEAVRGVRKRGRFRIEFRYIDGDEPIGPEQQLDSNLSVYKGRFSGRLMALELDMKKMHPKSVDVTIISSRTELDDKWHKALEAAWTAVLKKQPEENRGTVEHAKQATMTREEDLLKQLSAT